MTEVVAELYALDPEAFTAARDQLVRQLRVEGDRPGAIAVKQLRRPTVAAWLLNLVARERPAAVEAVLELGTRLRAAQSDAMAGRGGAALRELTADRRLVVQAAVDAAIELAQLRERGIAAAHVDEITRTVEAALADSDIADRWRSGLLSTAEQAAGFVFGAADALAVAQRETALRPPPAEKSAASVVRGRSAVPDDRPDQHVADLQRDVEAARAAVVVAQEELERCRSESASADQAARAARAALKDALKAATRADLAAATAEQALWAETDRASRGS
ncbi:MAG TPA: hypothetical protein VNB94_05030 [Mycobacteriales bacterium]|nr:hypothetical protein [Mycobacteriales bacterium]